MTGRTHERKSRRIVQEVCPVKRPLLSIAKITKAGNQVYLDEDKALRQEQQDGADHKGWKSSLLGRGQGLRQEQQDGADHKPPSRGQRVDARPVGKETS